MSIYSELKRRNVLRVALAYIVSSWLLIQVAETIFPLFGFGDEPARIAVIVLAIGFVPVLIVSWVFELTPEGWKKDSDADHGPVAGTQSAKRLDYIIMLVLAVSLAYFAFDKFVLSQGREQAIAESARAEALVLALETINSNKSIAVLPFIDMSEDQDQAYFADGMTEQLLNELARLEGLNVTGRRSSFQFKGHDESLRDIGEQLGVGYILEGSIRKQNEDLKISARLNNSQTGIQVWFDEYDARLSDIFQIQEDIARKVAGALSITLDVEGRNHLPGARTNRVAAYSALLEGRAFVSTGDDTTAAEHFERAIELDENYVDAWAGLSFTAALRSWGKPLDEARAEQERGRKLVEHAIELDPTFAEGYGMLGNYQWARGDWIGATEYHQAYSALVPADIPARIGDANILGKTGRIRDALKIDELGRRNDPLNYFAMTIRAEHYIQVARYEDAETEFANIAKRTSSTNQAVELRRMLMAFSKREPEQIRETLQNYARADSRVADIVSAVLDQFDSPAPDILALLHRLYDEETEMTGEGRLITASLAAHFGDPELALEIMSKELRSNLVRVGRIWYPFFSDMRRLPGFKTLAEDIGFVAYWREYEWADLCRPLGDNDFECE